LDLELDACTWAKKSRWMASAWTRQASHFMRMSPSVRAKAIDPSSHTTTPPSRLSSSLSQARSCPYSSTATACEGDRALHQSTSRNWCHDKGASLGKRLHRVKTHLVCEDAHLEEASIPVRQDGTWRRSQRGLLLRECLPWFAKLAITDDGVGRASRSMVGKGDFYTNSSMTKSRR
jgi:hypothetical protein